MQDNQYLSVEIGVLRGLHYQLNPKAQAKLVRVVSGAIYDVAVDREILWSDPAIGIDWPTANPILSDKDQKHRFLKMRRSIFEN